MIVACAILACFQPAAGGPVDTAIERVLSDWAGHQEVLDGSVSEWSIVRHDRSATFGGGVGSSHSPGPPRRIVDLRPPSPANELQAGGESIARERGQDRTGESMVRIVWTQNGIRVESACPPGDAVVGPRSQFARDYLGEQTTKARFDAALRSRFTVGMQDVPTRSQPYVLIRTTDSETHFWDAVGDAPPCAAVVEAGQAVEYFDAPVVALMVEAIGNSVAWEREHDRGLAAASSFSVSVGSPRVLGQTCVVIDEDRGAAGNLRYWVDPEHNHRVLRCFVRGSDGELRQQFDYAYTDDDESNTGREPMPRDKTVPRRINIMLFRNPMVIHDVLTVERTQLLSESAADDAVPSAEFPPKTLVTDFIAARQYLTEGDGRETNLRSQQENSTAVEVKSTGSLVSRLWTWQGMASCVLVAGTILVFVRWLQKRKDSDKFRSHQGHIDEKLTEHASETQTSAIIGTSTHRESGDG